MFTLSDEEVKEAFTVGNDVSNRSRSQIATLNKGRGHNIKYRPYAFTEHGILMLASVLKSEVAALVSIRITNAFVAMRKALASIAPLLARIEATDKRQIADQAKNDANQERNEERFKLLQRNGYRILRFLAEDVCERLDAVLGEIGMFCNSKPNHTT